MPVETRRREVWSGLRAFLLAYKPGFVHKPDLGIHTMSGDTVSVAEKINSLAESEHVPLTVHLELTYRCNLRCFHCYLGGNGDGEELSFEEIESVLDQLGEAGCLFLVLTGGEILLREDLFQILDAAKSRGFALTLFTNGTLIDERAAERIQSLSPLKVEVSVYGRGPETHDKVTGTAGSFQASISAVRLLRERGVKVTIKSPLMKENLREAREIAALAESLGASSRFDSLIAPKNDGSKAPLSHRAGGEDLMQSLSELGLLPKVSRPIDPGGRELLCGAGMSMCSISPSGDVYPCIQLLIKLGNMREEPFQKIWERSEILSKLQALRNSDLYACKLCNLSSYCNRCPGLALLEDGDLLGPSQACCELAELRGRLLRVRSA